MKAVMFKVGDLAVYPAHGVGVIESIESKWISGNKQEFYIMRILDNGMIIMIPLDNVNHVGLRQVIDAAQVPKIFEILRKKRLSRTTRLGIGAIVNIWRRLKPVLFTNWPRFCAISLSSVRIKSFPLASER